MHRIRSGVGGMDEGDAAHLANLQEVSATARAHRVRADVDGSDDDDDDKGYAGGEEGGAAARGTSAGQKSVPGSTSVAVGSKRARVAMDTSTGSAGSGVSNHTSSSAGRGTGRLSGAVARGGVAMATASTGSGSADTSGADQVDAGLSPVGSSAGGRNVRPRRGSSRGAPLADVADSAGHDGADGEGGRRGAASAGGVDSFTITSAEIELAELLATAAAGHAHGGASAQSGTSIGGVRSTGRGGASRRS